MYLNKIYYISISLVMSTKRIITEIKELKNLIENEPIDEHRFIEINMINNNINELNIFFMGPKITPYEEMLNHIVVKIPKEYPNRPPTLQFINKIFHPNISSEGRICLDILSSNWKPVYTLRTVLMSIMLLLSDPNPDSPLNGEAANLYKKSISDKEMKLKYEYIKKIEDYAKAVPKQPKSSTSSYTRPNTVLQLDHLQPLQQPIHEPVPPFQEPAPLTRR
jgi:ubiquitin-protein ligase